MSDDETTAPQAIRRGKRIHRYSKIYRSYSDADMQLTFLADVDNPPKAFYRSLSESQRTRSIRSSSSPYSSRRPSNDALHRSSEDLNRLVDMSDVQQAIFSPHTPSIAEAESKDASNFTLCALKRAGTYLSSFIDALWSMLSGSYNDDDIALPQSDRGFDALEAFVLASTPREKSHHPVQVYNQVEKVGKNGSNTHPQDNSNSNNCGGDDAIQDCIDVLHDLGSLSLNPIDTSSLSLMHDSKDPEIY